MAVGTLTKLGGNLEQPRDSKPSDYTAVAKSKGEGGSSVASKCSVDLKTGASY